jgi:hypothetical protein
VSKPAFLERGSAMAHNFGSLVFTPVIQGLQERYGSRRQYAKFEESGVSRDRLGPQESAFLAERDSFYIASVGETGWPYIQHRGGPKGFLKVINEHTVAFADFRGKQAVHQHRKSDDGQSRGIDPGRLPSPGASEDSRARRDL